MLNRNRNKLQVRYYIQNKIIYKILKFTYLLFDIDYYNNKL